MGTPLRLASHHPEQLRIKVVGLRLEFVVAQAELARRRNRLELRDRAADDGGAWLAKAWCLALSRHSDGIEHEAGRIWLWLIALGRQDRLRKSLPAEQHWRKAEDVEPGLLPIGDEIAAGASIAAHSRR